MANQDHLGILKQGVKIWNTWRKANPAMRPILSYADLRRASLWGANLTLCRVGGTSFGNMDLSTVQGLNKVNHNNHQA
jgi:uncharacterized protein YjbI with pentapeptide repeats